MTTVLNVTVASDRVSRSYIEKKKDTETKIEIPTLKLKSVLVTVSIPRVSVLQISHNSTEAQTETEKQVIPNHTHNRDRLLRREARSPAHPDSRVKCKQTVDTSYINWNPCMYRGRLYIYK